MKVNEKKVEKVIEKLHKIINKSGLNVPEIVLTYGNLGYHLGASMAGFQYKGPDLETLKREYYLNPTVDVGLMIQGLMITGWEDGFKIKPELSRFAEINKKEKEEEEEEEEKK